MDSNIITVLTVLLASTVTTLVLFFSCKSIFKKYWRVFNKAENSISKSIYTGTILIGVAILLAGFFIIFWQLFIWLKHGEWRNISLLKVVLYIGIDPIVSWLKNPQSWFGVHKIIYWFFISFPLSLFLIITGFMLANTECNYEEMFKKEGNKK
ncbi:MAG: hypothetical protein U9R20_00520 [Thermodesulfobacteriota bacterium]|nr:hypothetical protein [Thermodesulfobacteriota bacterium]